MAQAERMSRRNGLTAPPRLIASQLLYQLRILTRTPLSAFVTLVVPLMVLLAVNLLYAKTHLLRRGGISYAQFFTPAMVVAVHGVSRG